MWRWLDRVKQFVSDTLRKVLKKEDLNALALERVGRTSSSMTQLAQSLAQGDMALPAWQQAMRQTLKDQYIQEYILGRGGLSQMTAQDWGSIGGQLAKQYRHLDGFAQDIARGNLTEAQIAARAQMYTRSSQQSYWRAQERTNEWPKLPAYPGDGSTQCRTNCQCEWRLVRVDERTWHAYWELRPAEHCPDCVDRAQKWNPLVLTT